MNKVRETKSKKIKINRNISLRMKLKKMISFQFWSVKKVRESLGGQCTMVMYIHCINGLGMTFSVLWFFHFMLICFDSRNYSPGNL